jgi:CheY-like chemotaxis protein
MAIDRSKKCILVVDDEAAIRDLLTDILSDLGYRVVAVADGETALVAARQETADVALAVIDLSLPGMGGLDTLQALRAERPALRAIISTGYEDSWRHPSGLSLRGLGKVEGFSVLEKPYRIDMLTDAVGRELEDQPT